MELILSRAEFFALTALTRAPAIIGLDPDQLLPPDLDARRALYAEGEASLVSRDLIRIDAAGAAELEQNVLRLFGFLTTPSHAVVSVKRTPGIGRQLFLHYGLGGWFVEQTLPDERTHRIADVGDGAALAARLEAIYPLAPAERRALSFAAEPAALMEAYNAASEGDLAAARTALPDLSEPAARAADRFLTAAARQDFSGSIAFVQVNPGEENTASECLVVSAAGENWLLIAAGDGAAQAGAITPADFDQLLRSLLVAG
jgi:hypothetical protein